MPDADFIRQLADASTPEDVQALLDGKGVTLSYGEAPAEEPAPEEGAGDLPPEPGEEMGGEFDDYGEMEEFDLPESPDDFGEEDDYYPEMDSPPTRGPAAKMAITVSRRMGNKKGFRRRKKGSS